jgi:hypothetical protein
MADDIDELLYQLQNFGGIKILPNSARQMIESPMAHLRSSPFQNDPQTFRVPDTRPCQVVNQCVW